MARASLLAIVGPTASGKTAASLDIAQRFDGEIICADSRTIYRGMDIGTAKPTLNEQALVRHHLLDILNPDERFTVADFQRLANEAIKDIQSRGKLPIISGGTGLYVDAVLYNYSFRHDRDPKLHATLLTETNEQLQRRIQGLGVELNNSDYHNPRRLIRAIETAGQPSAKHELRAGAAIVGINPGREIVLQRITQRVVLMMEQGFYEEVCALGQRYGWDTEAMSGIGYRLMGEVVRGEKSIQEAQAEFIQGDWSLAKRQITWLKRNPDIQV